MLFNLTTDELAKKVSLANFVFGALVLAGGLYGFYKTGSIASIASSFVFGNLLMLSIWGSQKPVQNPDSAEKPKILSLAWGFYAATLISVVLLIFFVIRLMGGAGAMPGVPIIILSAAAIFLNVAVIHGQNTEAATLSTNNG